MDCLNHQVGSKRKILKQKSSPTKFVFSDIKANRKPPKDRTTPGNNVVEHLRKPAARRCLKFSAPDNGTAGENVEILPTSKDDQSDKENEHSQLKIQPLDGDILASCEHKLDSKTATSNGSPNPDESPFQGTD